MTATKTERSEILADSGRACAACPWRVANHGKPHPEGWYTKANRRRLWNGLRTGEAPGMTCHPTDPENQPVGEHVETRECAGAMLLVAREWAAFTATSEAGGNVTDYRRGREAPFTKGGLAELAYRLMFGGTALDPRARLAGRTFAEDEGVQLGLRTVAK